jgi:photosystem II stability/assembly factor-like uncharacterized protein
MIAYAGTPNMGVLRTVNGGATWAPVNMGLTQLKILSLAVAPDNNALLFAGTDNGLFRSIDSASSWTLTNGTAGLRVAAVVVHPKKTTQLYLAAPNGGVFQSIDGGASWSPDNAGLGDSYVNAVAVDPTTIATLFAGTAGSGVFKAGP